MREFELHELQREVLSEVIEVRLRGRPAAHPASIVLPLLLSDLPAFCRWRGEPRWSGSAFDEILGVVDRLVVDSAEWRSPGQRLRAASSRSSTAPLSPTSRTAARCRGGCGWQSVARDPLDPLAARDRPASRRAAARRLAALPAAPQDRTPRDGRGRRDSRHGRRRSGRPAGRDEDVTPSALLSARARRALARPGLRGGRPTAPRSSASCLRDSREQHSVQVAVRRDRGPAVHAPLAAGSR